MDFEGRTVLVLGTGGTSRTVTAAAKAGGAKEVLCASRAGGPGALDYNRAAARQEVQVVVNTSPAGMYPEVESCLLDPAAFPRLEAVLDVVYNPSRPSWCSGLRNWGHGGRGPGNAGGPGGVCRPAFYRAGNTRELHRPGVSQHLGRPGQHCAGGHAQQRQDTIGRMLAKALDSAVDLDVEIERASGQSVPSILRPRGRRASAGGSSG